MAYETRLNFTLMLVLVIALGVVGYYVFNTTDKRDAGQKIGDAISVLPSGIDKAADQLKDHTPGEKLGDAAKNAGEDFKKAINQGK